MTKALPFDINGSSALSSILQIQTARAFLPLLKPKRFKGARGGRGSGKSHFYAEMLVEETLSQHTRAACVREMQASIKDSVKQLIEDKIDALGVSSLFKITETEIVGPHDSLYIFRGLQNHTAASIKSLEGFTRAWIEEAQTISQRSIDMLTPTFRTKSELWFSWNPLKATDPVDKLFRENAADPDFECVTVNYYDNPWFPDELRRDMERDKRRDPDKYAHVWLGEYERASEARVFRNWRIEAFETVTPERFYYGADWGFSVDPTALIRMFIRDRTIYVDHEAYAVGCTLDQTPALFDKVPGSRLWPIKADNSRPETIAHLNARGFRISPAKKGAGSVEDGVEFLKSYDIVVHPRCVRVADELAAYSYKTDRKTNEVLPVLEDANNHCIDAMRYGLEDARRTSEPSIRRL